ncbi:MAG: hypothetical protein ACFN2Z_06770 [Oribacterium sp.]
MPFFHATIGDRPYAYSYSKGRVIIVKGEGRDVGAAAAVHFSWDSAAEALREELDLQLHFAPLVGFGFALGTEKAADGTGGADSGIKDSASPGAERAAEVVGVRA